MVLSGEDPLGSDDNDRAEAFSRLPGQALDRPAHRQCRHDRAVRRDDRRADRRDAGLALTDALDPSVTSALAGQHTAGRPDIAIL